MNRADWLEGASAGATSSKFKLLAYLLAGKASEDHELRGSSGMSSEASAPEISQRGGWSCSLLSLLGICCVDLHYVCRRVCWGFCGESRDAAADRALPEVAARRQARPGPAAAEPGACSVRCVPCLAFAFVPDFCLLCDLGMFLQSDNGLLGEVPTWDGGSRRATIDDMLRLNQQLPSNHLLKCLQLATKSASSADTGGGTASLLRAAANPVKWSALLVRAYVWCAQDSHILLRVPCFRILRCCRRSCGLTSTS